MMKTRTTVHTLLLPALCAVYLDIGTVEGHDVDADDWSKIGVRSDVTVLMQHFLKVDECLLSLEAMCTSDVFRQFVSELLLGTFFYFSDGMRKLTEVHELAASRDSGAGWSSRSPAEVHRLKQVMQQSSRGAKVRARAPVAGALCGAAMCSRCLAVQGSFSLARASMRAVQTLMESSYTIVAEAFVSPGVVQRAAQGLLWLLEMIYGDRCLSLKVCPPCCPTWCDA